jgi:hypothetical protein
MYTKYIKDQLKSEASEEMHRKLPLYHIICQTIQIHIRLQFIFTIRFNIIPQYGLTYFMLDVSYGLLIHAYVNEAIPFLTLMAVCIIFGSFKTWCWKSMEQIAWTERVSNEVRNRIKEIRNILHTV